MDFGLLYENDQGEYVFACLLALFTLTHIACLLHICDKINKFALLYLGPRPNNKQV